MIGILQSYPLDTPELQLAGSDGPGAGSWSVCRCVTSLEVNPFATHAPALRQGCSSVAQELCKRWVWNHHFRPMFDQLCPLRSWPPVVKPEPTGLFHMGHVVELLVEAGVYVGVCDTVAWRGLVPTWERPNVVLGCWGAAAIPWTPTTPQVVAIPWAAGPPMGCADPMESAGRIGCGDPTGCGRRSHGRRRCHGRDHTMRRPRARRRSHVLRPSHGLHPWAAAAATNGRWLPQGVVHPWSAGCKILATKRT